MQDGMSVYPRLHFSSDNVMAAKKLGLTKTAGENKSTDVIVRLGLRLIGFVLTPRDKCTHVEAIVGKFIAHIKTEWYKNPGVIELTQTNIITKSDWGV